MKKEAPTIPKKRVVRVKREGSFFEKYLSFSSTLQLIGVVIVLCAGYVAIQSNYSGIKNLINTDQATLKAAMTGDLPYLFHCNRGGKEEIVPPIFSELNSRLGSKFGFASLNCSQTLTSGKTIFDRFKLQKDWRPCIFGTAPWLSKPIQVTPNHMKDIKTFGAFIDKNFAPKAVEIGTDNELKRICGFSNKKTSTSSDTPESEMSSIKNTCLVIVKGTRYAKSHAELEERLIRHIPRAKVCMIDAMKKRLSIEDTNSFPADTFAMKIYAVRNGTHYLQMTNPITWDYINTFVSYAFATPLTAYSTPLSINGQKQIHLIKMASSFKDRSSPDGRYKSGSSGGSSSSSSGTKSSTSKKSKSTPKKKSGSSGSSSKSAANDEDSNSGSSNDSDDNDEDSSDNDNDGDDEEEIIEL